MGCQKAVILIVVFLFIAPFVFSQNECVGTPPTLCTDSNLGSIDSSYNCICAYDDSQTIPLWKNPDAGKIYRIGTDDNAFDVVSDGSVWYGCDAEGNDNAYSFPPGNEKGENIAISVTAPSTHEYICYKKDNQEKWGECYGDAAEFSTTGGTTHPAGQRVPDEPLFYYCTPQEKWAAKITDLETCSSAGLLYGGITWTGSRCCGEEYGEYYNEPLLTQAIPGGCWHDTVVQSNRVSDINFISNPDLEIDSDNDGLPNSWSYISVPSTGTVTLSLTYATKQSKEKSFLIDASGITDTGLYGIKSTPIAVRPDATYAYSAYINIASINGEIRADAACYNNWHDDNEQAPAFTKRITLTAPTADWVYRSGAFATTSATKHCHILLYFTKGAAGTGLARAWFDNTNLYEDNPYVLNFRGQFYGCTKTDSDFNAPSGLINTQNYCSSYGDYFCSYSKNGWSSAVDDLNTRDDGSLPLANQRQYARTKTFGNLLLNPLFR